MALALRLQRLILISWIPVFLSALVFFVMAIELIEIIPNLYRYLSSDVHPRDIGRVALLYFPTALILAIPIAVLFSVNFTLSSLHVRNELIAMFSSGISLFKLVWPLIIVATIISVGLFVFEDSVVINSLRGKNQFHRKVLQLPYRFDNFDITILNPDGNIIYHADHYDDDSFELYNVMVIKRDYDEDIDIRLDASRAKWVGNYWKFIDVRVFSWTDIGAGRFMSEEQYDVFYSSIFNTGPSAFRRDNHKLNEMKFRDGLAWAEVLRLAGRKNRSVLTQAYAKISYAMTPLAGTLIAVAIGGRMKKNILLMSLLLVLGIGASFYIFRVLGIILSQIGFLPPEVGAFGVIVLFLLVGLSLIKTART